LTAQGRTGALFRRELAALMPGNRELYRRIIGIERENAALEKAAEKARGVADERKSLENQLLELQGRTDELRRRELRALDPTNRALQKMIWGLEDAKEAMEALKPEDFATSFDYLKAIATAGRGAGSPYAAPMAMVPNTDRATEAAETARELRELRAENVKLMNALIRQSRRSADMLESFNIVGLPPERT